MTYKNFEEYLMVKCIKYTHALDDMLPDVYESWITEQDIEDIIAWANLYGEHKVIQGVDRAIEKLKVETIEGGEK